MDNFDLRKYLAEGKLLKENTERTVEGEIRDYFDTLIKNQPEDALNLIMDLISNDGGNFKEWIDDIQSDIVDSWGGDYDGPIRGYREDDEEDELDENLNEEIEDEGPEEDAFDAEFQNAANQLAATIGKELKDKKAENPEALNEAIVTSVIAGILTGNAVLGFISKMSAKLMKKLNWKKGEDFAEKVHHWAHDNEKAFQAPIKRVLAFFIKDEAKLEATTKAIYAIVVASMAAGYGAHAIESLGKADWFQGALGALKTVAKGEEAVVNAFPAIKGLMS